MQDSEDGTPVGLETITFPSAATYTLVEEIGRGGMGIVYLAEKGCAGVTDLVALKTIKTISKEHAQLLAREANTASQLRHENIVKTYGLEMVPIAALPPHVRASLEKGALRPLVLAERWRRRWRRRSPEREVESGLRLAGAGGQASLGVLPPPLILRSSRRQLSRRGSDIRCLSTDRAIDCRRASCLCSRLDSTSDESAIQRIHRRVPLMPTSP